LTPQERAQFIRFLEELRRNVTTPDAAERAPGQTR
jgi:hypothetical protein